VHLERVLRVADQLARLHEVLRADTALEAVGEALLLLGRRVCDLLLQLTGRRPL